MPLYDYDCAACGTRFEVVHGVHAEGPGTCPHCGGGPVRKAFAPPAIHFKGSGWAKKERRASSTSGRAAKTDDAAATGSTADAAPAGASASSDGASSSSTTSSAGPAASGPAPD